MRALHPLSGIVPILYAFFGPDGSLDRAAMRHQAQAVRAAGATAIALLGLATEVDKLSAAERRQLIDWAAEDAGGLPLVVTINGASVDEQVELASYAERAGAQWLILQPPSRARAEAAVQRGEARDSEAFCDAFFRQVLARTTLPAGIQNAPEYLGVGLSPASILRLAQDLPNFRLLKGEGPSVLIRELIESVGERLPVFNGRGGQELLDNLRAGCAGMIVAPDCFDRQVRIAELFRQGEVAQAEALYADTLPAIVFVMQSLATLVCYGKRIAAWRMGLPEVVDRAPALAPTAFGLVAARRFADRLGPLR
jgi:4-hydroxy-tetrahydrodipicolinate synthase